MRLRCQMRHWLRLPCRRAAAKTAHGEGRCCAYPLPPPCNRRRHRCRHHRQRARRHGMRCLGMISWRRQASHVCDALADALPCEEGERQALEVRGYASHDSYPRTRGYQPPLPQRASDVMHGSNLASRAVRDAGQRGYAGNTRFRFIQRGVDVLVRVAVCVCVCACARCKVGVTQTVRHYAQSQPTTPPVAGTMGVTGATVVTPTPAAAAVARTRRCAATTYAATKSSRRPSTSRNTIRC